MLGAADIASAVRAGDASPTEMVRASFNRARDIGAGHDELNIFLHSDQESSEHEAKSMQERLQSAADSLSAHGSHSQCLSLFEIGARNLFQES